MIPEYVLNLLHFLRNNVVSGVETLKQARMAIERFDGLTEGEKLFLDVALIDKHTLEEFDAVFISGQRIRLTA